MKFKRYGQKKNGCLYPMATWSTEGAVHWRVYGTYIETMNLKWLPSLRPRKGKDISKHYRLFDCAYPKATESSTCLLVHYMMYCRPAPTMRNNQHDSSNHLVYSRHKFLWAVAFSNEGWTLKMNICTVYAVFPPTCLKNYTTLFGTTDSKVQVDSDKGGTCWESHASCSLFCDYARPVDIKRDSCGGQPFLTLIWDQVPIVFFFYMPHSCWINSIFYL